MNIVREKRITVSAEKPNRDVLREAAECIRRGELAAFPTETVYGLGANGLDEEAAKKIYAAKGRPSDNPLILHIADIEEVDALVKEIPANARALMEAFWPGPLTIVMKRSSVVPQVTAGGLDTVAIRLPDAPIARELIRLAGVPIAAPSANLSGRPSPTSADTVAEDMDGRIAMIVDGGACDIGVESTIVDCTSPIPTILRPGGITFEMLYDLLGEVEIDPALTDESQRPKAPGMKYRHYAPQADAVLFEGTTEAVLPKIMQAVEAALAEGKCVGVLASDALTAQMPQAVKTIGYGDRNDCSRLASMLYDTLRRFDEEGADIIFLEGVAETGLGLAVMNRLRKACGNQIVSV